MGKCASRRYPAIIEVVERQKDEYDPSVLGISSPLWRSGYRCFVARELPSFIQAIMVEPGDVLISGTYYDTRGQRQQGRSG